MSRFLWSQKLNNIGPSARSFTAMAYDASKQKMILFGGVSATGQPLNDTWEFDGTNWTQVADVGPSPRRFHQMVFDTIRKVVVLFGGNPHPQFDFTGALGDTWEWDGNEWTEVANTGPLNRVGHAMAFDEINNVTLLFGGFDGAERIFNDTWSWDGAGWVQLEDSAPGIRNTHAMCFDNVAKKIVLFGGFGGNGENKGDTWQWSGTAWTQITEIGPGRMSNHSMVSTATEVILFGGSDTPFFGNTWQWKGLHWTQIQDMGPQPRGNFAMAYDSDRKKIVLFGGTGPDAQNVMISLADTWEGFWR